MRFTWMVYILLAVNADVNGQQDESERDIINVEAVNIIKDYAVDIAVGPKNATYCRLEDPTGAVVFDGSSQCRLTLNRVAMEHDGIWNMTIGLPGRVLTEDVLLTVNVMEADSKMVVLTRVENQQPSVKLSCSVSHAYTVRGCSFRDPRGKTLVATQEGESEEDPAVRYSTNISNHECSLLSTNPVESVLGAWRCAVETDLGTHYGFLSVICPWLLNDTENKDDYYLEPFLDTQRESISAVEGAVTMSCIIHAPIRYCYFEASNGTKISVAPETLSTDLKYVGSGFNAGECGVRFTKLVAGDSGTWSCHVGLVNQTGEQSIQFQVTIEEQLKVRHYWHESYGLVVEARVHPTRTLHYCIFVRFDGLVLTTKNISADHKLISIDERHRLLRIKKTSGLDLYPWIIIAKVKKHGFVTRNTTDNVFWFKQTASGANVTGQQATNDKFEIQRVLLSRIDRVTRIGEHIDMSLDNSEQEELCYFISPNGEDSTIVESIAGVTVHERSIFVSCRMTVGPIERSLIGNWTLCARRTDTVIHERCQHINVTFSNNNNPSAAWHVNERPQFNHSVSLGRYLTPVVIGDGNTRSCHIITPDGEDLIITHDTNYRNLELVSLNPSTRTCSVRIGPIESWMMGEWTLYGMFRRKANNEVRLPMRLLFYDEENPYTQPYNITNLDSINRNVPLGRTITLEVTGTGNTDECEYRPPTGQRYLFNATDHFLV
ncbi:uncharacterized protein LOC119188581 isoform X1 [Manduca sexta]|uniref:uncharacterized protein LOC119188581 isoform X1 n=1 Tax=Manduca sexta TaxID=7130 RepID=UPI00188F1C59|nr:uncharacterized protein LOC119188581 isoform X1 [Manduca sexta]